MNRQPSIYLTAIMLLGAPLLAQDAPPRPPPAPEAPKPEAPKPEPRKDDARRDGPGREANPERPLPPPRADGERPLPPPGRDGFGPDGPPPGGPREGGPRYFQRRLPDDPRGDRSDAGRPPGGAEGPPESFGRAPVPGAPGDRFGQNMRSLKPTPYLGVVTSPVPPVLAAQLGLKEGFSLVVDDVLPESPAQAAGLQKYDVLKLVNDQQLVDSGHLSGLVRGLGKDTEVTVTFIRKGQEQKATVKIGEKMIGERQPGSDLQRRFGAFGLGPPQREGGNSRDRDMQGPGPEQMQRFQDRMQHFQENMRHYQEQFRTWQKDHNAPLPEPPPPPELGFERGDAPTGPADLLREARPGGAPQLRLPQADGVSTFATSRARMVMKDNDGEVEVAMRDGRRMLTAKDAEGKIAFTGPVDTPEQRAAVPQKYRAKFDAIETQQRNLTADRAPAPRGRDEAPFPPPPPPLPEEAEVQ